MIYVPKYLWAKTVKDLDNWKCAFCGDESRLEAHHIRQKTLSPELETDLENGITLCHSCHYAAHGGNYQTRTHGAAMQPFKSDPALVGAFIRDYADTRIVLEIPHTMMTKIKAHAEQRGESLNGFICRAIENQLKQDEQTNY